MSSSHQAVKDGKGDDVAHSSENLAFLYQGLLTIIVRLQAGREQIPEAQSFRARAKKLLLDAESEAKRVGYENDDIKDASLAVVAFLDSVVLNSSEAGRAEWERKSLAEELLNIPDAGEAFFKKLDDLLGRAKTSDLGDVLEVYSLCLLLGFEGRYKDKHKDGERAELESVRNKTRRRIDEIRGKPELLSPYGVLPDTPAAVVAAPVPVYSMRRYAVIAATALAVALLCFLLLKIDLIWEAGRASGKLL